MGRIETSLRHSNVARHSAGTSDGDRRSLRHSNVGRQSAGMPDEDKSAAIPEGGGMATEEQVMIDVSRQGKSELASEDLPEDVTELDASHNELESLPPVLFRRLSSLQRLTLDNNRLKTLNVDMSRLVALEALSVAKNQLKELKIQGCKRLQTLNVSHNMLKSLQPLSDFPALFSLDASHNQLTEVPSMANLPSLTKLALSNNKLKDVPSTLARAAPNLREFYVSHNRLNKVPKELPTNMAIFRWRFNPLITDKPGRDEDTFRFVDPDTIWEALDAAHKGSDPPLNPVKVVSSTWLIERARKLMANASHEGEIHPFALPRRQDLETTEPQAFVTVDELTVSTARL